MSEKLLGDKFLQNNNNYSEVELKKLRYGLEGIYLTITKIVIINKKTKQVVISYGTDTKVSQTSQKGQDHIDP